MKIVIDKKIPYIEGVLEPYFDVVYLDGDKIDSNACRDCDAMIVRTRTKCNRELLEGSSVKIIATATIGMDHIDLDYCNSSNIEVHNASGCNATAVVQYVMAVMAQNALDPSSTTIGIVGYGNIGSLLAKRCSKLGFNVLAYDPFKEITVGEKCETLKSLLTRSDLVTLHVPLTKSGEHKSENMANSDFFENMKKSAIFVNSSRGEVVDEVALLAAIRVNKLSFNAIDVWRDEPGINSELLCESSLTTSHIAGYSKRGKERATEMSIATIAEKFDISELRGWQIAAPIEYDELKWEQIIEMMPRYFDILSETIFLKNHPEKFENIRNCYKYREEFF